MPRSLKSDFPARLVVTLAIRGYLVVRFYVCSNIPILKKKKTYGCISWSNNFKLFISLPPCNLIQ